MPSLQLFYGPDAAVGAQEARPSQHVSGYRVSLRMAQMAGALSHREERGQWLTLGGHHTMTIPWTPLGDSCQKFIIRTCHVGTNPQGGTSTKLKACTPQKCQGHDTQRKAGSVQSARPRGSRMQCGLDLERKKPQPEEQDQTAANANAAVPETPDGRLLWFRGLHCGKHSEALIPFRKAQAGPVEGEGMNVTGERGHMWVWVKRV